MASPGRPKFWTDEKIHEMADKLEEWSLKDDSLFLNEFIATLERGMNRDTFNEWVHSNTYFSDAYHRTKERILGRAKRGAARKELDSRFMVFHLGYNDPEFKKHLREQKEHEIKKQAEVNATTVNYSKCKCSKCEE